MPNLQETIDFFFDSDAPGSIMLCLDPLRHYRPRSQNFITLYQGSAPEEYFRHRFIPDNIQAATLCAYIPDASLVRFDIPDPSVLPKPTPDTLYTTYVDRELLPYLIANCNDAAESIPLRKTTFKAQRKETPPLNVYREWEAYRIFVSEQQYRERLYRCDPEFRTPLIVAQTEHGYLFFSDNPLGQEGLREYARKVVDHYFDPHPGLSFLNLYEFPYITAELVPLIDLSRSFGTLWSPYRFTSEVYTPEHKLPQGFREELKPIISSELVPHADDFMHLAKYLHNWHRTHTPISEANMDIYRLLAIKETGYINIHSQPFSFDEAFRPLAEQLEQTTQVKSPEQLDMKRLEELIKQARQLADYFLKDEFDVRGHRTLERMLEDPREKMVIGHIELPSSAKRALLGNCSLYLPADPKHGTVAAYAQLSEDRRSILLSPTPQKKRVYTVSVPQLEPPHKKKNHTPHL